jgi:hypothetical protein
VTVINNPGSPVPRSTFPVSKSARAFTIVSNTVRLTAAPPTRELNAMRDDVYLLESPLTLVAGTSRTLSVVFQRVTAVSSPVATVYKDGSDVTATVMPAGSASVAGNVATLKPLTALIGGEEYVLALSVTADGDTDVKKLIIKAVAPGEP